MGFYLFAHLSSKGLKNCTLLIFKIFLRKVLKIELLIPS